MVVPVTLSDVTSAARTLADADGAGATARKLFEAPIRSTRTHHCGC